MASPARTLTDGAYHDSDVLVDAHWLDEHLDDPGLRLLDVDVSPVAYDAGHIPGAVLWNVYRDVKDADYRLVDRAGCERLAARSGIVATSTVVCYGYAPAMAFWLLKLYGHDDVRILDCARTTWAADGRPWTTATSTPMATAYPLPDQDDRIRATWSAVDQAIDDPTIAILDVRTGAEYRGERFWPSGAQEPGARAGHVPSAINLPIDDVHDVRGSFRSAAELRSQFSAVDAPHHGPVICYCTIGGRACTAWFVLTYLLGRADVRVYDGSWAEWGRMAATPVAG